MCRVSKDSFELALGRWHVDRERSSHSDIALRRDNSVAEGQHV